MDQTTHDIRLANWKAIIEQCQARPQGQSAKQWLAENGISEKQYYYWLRRIRKQAAEQMNLPAVSGPRPPAAAQLAEIPVESILPAGSAPMITIRTKKSTIEISCAVPESLAIRLVKAVAHAL